MAYRNHFLTDVILRVDFLAPVEAIKTELVASVRAACAKSFPIFEARNVETQEVVVSNIPGNQNTVINSQKSTEWHFWGKGREKELTITHNCMFVNFKAYSSYEELHKEFFDVFSALLSAYPSIKINRMGLRYINQINLLTEKTNRKNWSSYWSRYINSALVQSLAFADDDLGITRHMSSIEMNYGDYMLRFQYGIFNPDYPAPNKKQQFIIDTDVYSAGLFSAEEVQQAISVYHEKAQEWFEKAIKTPLRTRMGEASSDES